jgi:hypothetical protein
MGILQFNEYLGDVVYYTQPGEPQEYYTKAKTLKAKIIDSLIMDMDDAAPKLEWLSTARGRVNRGVALGIKAKLALLTTATRLLQTLLKLS